MKVNKFVAKLTRERVSLAKLSSDKYTYTVNLSLYQALSKEECMVNLWAVSGKFYVLKKIVKKFPPWSTDQRGGSHLGEVAPVDDPQPGGGAELGPVGGTREPIQVLAQEGVHGGPGVHDGVGEHHRPVAHAVAHLQAALHVLQHLHAPRGSGGGGGG